MIRSDARKRWLNDHEYVIDALEDEALENALVEYDDRKQLFGESGAGAFFLAEHLLKSDWLARHDAKVKADLLYELANDHAEGGEAVRASRLRALACTYEGGASS